MCKKLMFLISLVALLSLANGTYGDDFVWDGEGANGNACDLANWEFNPPGVDPVSPPTSGDDCKTECKIADADSRKTIEIGPGCDIVCKRWYAPTRDGEAGADQTFNMTGGSLTVYDRWRAVDGGPSRRGDINISGDALINVISDDEKCTRWAADDPDSAIGLDAYVTIGGFAQVNIQPTIRAGAGDLYGGYANIVHEGESTVNITEHYRPCDEGTADVTLRGDAELNVGTAPAWAHTNASDWGHMMFNSKLGDSSLTVQDTAQLWCRNRLSLGGFDVGVMRDVDLTMTGGTINTGALDLATGINCTSTADISSGLVVVRGTLTAARSDGTSIATINLSGDAEVQCNSLSLQRGATFPYNGATMDISDDAQLILEGNVLTAVFALRDAGKLTACGGAQSPLMASYDGGSDKTTVWADCSIAGCAAWDPTPLNTATEVDQTLGLLEWRMGQGMGNMDFHYIFLSDDEACVTDADCGVGGSAEACSRGWERGDPNHDISDLSLDLWTTYYWRVDEFVTSCCLGYVWNFTTGCALVTADINMDCLVNFEDYALVASTWM